MRRILLWSTMAIGAAVVLAMPSADGAAPPPALGAVGAHTAPSDSAVLADSVRKVAQLLSANGAPEVKALPVAAAIMKYARKRALDPLLLVGIIGVENAALENSARSTQGAMGVMQVMPLWKREIRDCGEDLSAVDVNVCFGTQILRMAIDRASSLHHALLRYNGCLHGAQCKQYPTAVFNRAGRALLLAPKTP